MIFTLLRLAIRDEGAFGVFLCDDVPFATTLEHTYPPDNHVKIPPGTYVCPREMFNRGGYLTYEIPVLGHFHLLFHKGNVEADTNGCILVAKSFGRFGGVPGVAASRHGFSEFMDLADNAESINLEIENWRDRSDS